MELSKEKIIKVANRIEALLFLTSREFTPKALAKLLKESEALINLSLAELRKRHEGEKSSLVLRKIGKSFSLTVKPSYAEEFKEIVKRAELSNSELRVLAALKAKPSLLKSQLARALGSWVYEAIKSLKEKGFVKEQKVGKTSRLLLTEKFRDYFKEVA